MEAKIAKDAERINAFVARDTWEVSTAPSLEYERMITEDSFDRCNFCRITQRCGSAVRIDVTDIRWIHST